MNSIAKAVILVGSVVSLSACASCPQQGDYNRVPYDGTRTEGSGVAVYGGRCAQREEVQYRTETVEQQTAPVREAEPVFNQRIRK
ncbi:MAG TPA: hypothetical protein VGD95_08775 [Micavibrio sp.]